MQKKIIHDPILNLYRNGKMMKILTNFFYILQK